MIVNVFVVDNNLIAMSISTTLLLGVYLYNTIEYFFLRLDLVCMVRNLDSLPQFQQFQEKIQQVHIKMLAV